MKIALFSTWDNGGAGKAALRLNSALNQIGEDSTLFVKWKSTDHHKVIQLQTSEIDNKVFDKYIWKYFFINIYEGNTMASAMYPSIGFEYLKRLEEYDVVNLHWLPTFVSLEAIAKMRQMGKPIVWTLHDQNPMTGACHYTHGCEKYKFDCSECPQLKDNKYNVTQALLEARIKHLPKDLVVVTPSKWLAECARESKVFRNHRIDVIPNSLETDIYKPASKSEAKHCLGFPPTARVILFGAQELKEKRKGLAELVEAVKHLQENSSIKHLIAERNLYILTFGNPSSLLDDIGIPYKALGYVNEDETLRLAYSAADVVALPSLEDNLPNIMLESMACGTPVVSFNIGGMANVIKNGKNGYLAPLRDIKNFGERIADVINGHPMGEYCRRFAEERYNLKLQAERYRDLFQDIVNNVDRAFVLADIPAMFPETASLMASYICEAAIETQNEWKQLDSEKKLLVNEYNTLTQERDGLLQERDGLLQERDGLLQERDGLLQERDGLLQERDGLLQERDGLLQERDGLLQERDGLLQERDGLLQERDGLLQERDGLIRERDGIKSDYLRIEQELQCVYKSKSWRITKPLRGGWKIFKKIIKCLMPYGVVRYYEKKRCR